MEKVYTCTECGYAIRESELNINVFGIFTSPHWFQNESLYTASDFPDYDTDNDCANTQNDESWFLCECGLIENSDYGQNGVCEYCLSKES